MSIQFITHFTVSTCLLTAQELPSVTSQVPAPFHLRFVSLSHCNTPTPR